ncbi:MAG: hypothetical protein K0R03_818 [Moraxellaceae bacterium]|nr:hypothetical protein [Moraxellaceae bacterium]
MAVFRIRAGMKSWVVPRALCVLLLCLAGCSTVPRAPPNNPLAAAPLPLEPSVISLPISIDLGKLEREVQKQLPRPVVTSSQRRSLPVRFSAMRTSVSMEPGVCSVTELNCLSRNSIRTVAADLMTPTDAVVAQQMFVRDIDMSMDGSQFSLTAEVEFTLSTRLKSTQMPVGTVSCGEGRSRPRFELMLGGQAGWGPTGEVVLTPRPHYVRWLQPCNISAFHFNADAMLALPALREKLLGVVEQTVFASLRQGSLYTQLARAWPELSAPREIRPGVWLLPHPEKVAFAELAGKGRHVTTSVLVHAHPELVKGTRPDVATPPLPVPERGIGNGEGMYMAIRGDLPLAQAEQALLQKLAVLPTRAGEVQVQGVRLYGNAERAVLALTVGTPVNAEIHLLGKPVYDLERNEVRLEGLQPSADTRTFLGRRAPALLDDDFLATLQARARFGFDEALAGALHEFQDLRVAAGQDMTWRGGIRRMQPHALYFTRDRLVGYVLVEGKLALEARQK